MKPTNPYLYQLLILTLCGIVSMMAIIVSYRYYIHTKEKNQLTSRNITQSRAAISGLTRDKALIEKYEAPFLHLQAEGFYGEEDRLLWGETLKTIAQQKKLPSLKYSIGPQKPIDNIGQNTSSVALSQSIMHIDAGLGHEGDFIYISQMLTGLPGLVRIQDCSLTKADTIVLAPFEKNIELSCSLAWLTIKEYEESNSQLAEEFDVGEAL